MPCQLKRVLSHDNTIFQGVQLGRDNLNRKLAVPIFELSISGHGEVR